MKEEKIIEKENEEETNVTDPEKAEDEEYRNFKE